MTVKDKAQLAQLQAAMNASEFNPEGLVYCPMSSGDAAAVIFAYPDDEAGLTVFYDSACDTLHAQSCIYLVRGQLDQLITSFVGNWQHAANSPTR